MNQAVLDAIFQRRSIREFTESSVDQDLLREIIRAGSWAPSGLNNQPWRFVSITDPAIISELAEQTRYAHVVKAAPALIALFLDRREMYNEVKDLQASGACLQNMLLAAEALGLGAVWLGEILNRKDEVKRIIELDHNYELMAVVALGYPAHRRQKSKRKTLNEVIIKEIQGGH
jgi:nitroreductase